MADLAKTVDGWHVDERDGQATVLDTDLAERLSMKQPRDIRSTISKAIEDGALNIAGGDRDADSPTFWREEVTVSLGNSATITTTAYRLNRAAALFIVTRLRTPKAVELTLAIVKVFDQVTSGRTLAVATPADARVAEALASIASSLATLSAGHVALAKTVEQLTSGVTSPTSGRSFAMTVRSKMLAYATYRSDGTALSLKVWRSRGHTSLRRSVDWQHAWHALPAHRRQDVVVRLDDMVREAEKSSTARAQLSLVPNTGTGGE